jgi:hypothetical protein
MTYTYKLSRRLASSDNAIRTLRPLILILLALISTACGKGDLVSPHTPDTERATPGWVSLSLTTPRTDDGVVQMRVLGAAIDSVQLSGVGGFASMSGGVARFLITGRIASGVVARMWVPDTRKAAMYVATVNQAAAKATYQLQDLSQGYAATVTR